MIKKAFKWIFFGIGGFLIFTIILFHHAFFTFLATYSLQVYSIAKWGKILHFEEVILKDNRLIVSKPRLDEDFFVADYLALSLDVSFWKRQFHIELDMEKPHWHFHNSMVSQWEKWTNLLTQNNQWFRTDPRVSIREGMVTWSTENSSANHQIKFNFELNNQTGGSIKLHFDPSYPAKDPGTDCLVLQTVNSAQGVKVNCNCEKIHCPSLMAFAQFLGVDLSSWKITSGSLDGELTAIFSGFERPYLEGDLFTDGFTFNQSEGALEGFVGKAHLKLRKNPNADAVNDSFTTTIGELEILEPGSLMYRSQMQNWEILNIKGMIQLKEDKTAGFNLYGQGGSFPNPSDWHLQGKAALNAENGLNLDVALLSSTEEQPQGKIYFALNQLLEGSKRLTIHCNNISYMECSFLQSLLATYWPVFNQVIIQDGEINAVVEADFMPAGLGDVYVKHFEILHLRSKLKPWNLTCDFGQVRGYGKVQLGSEDFWQSLNGGLHLEDGQIEFEDLSPPLPMTDINAHLFIQQGHVEHSLVTLQVAGLKGNMDVEWGDQKQLLTFKLDGIVEDLADLFPNTLQEGLRKHFYHNRLMVLANLKRQGKQYELGGTIHIQRAQTEQMDLIHFGCEIKNTSDQASSKYVPVGWFHTQKLPLDKFLSPFIFSNGILQMSGEAEFKGSFDDQSLLIKYDADNLKIENEHLCIDIPSLHSPVPGQLIGSYQMDLRNNDCYGTFPLQSASYYQKNCGLAFQDVQGNVVLKNHSIEIHPLEAYCEGIFFNGELKLDYSDPNPGFFNLSIQAPTLSGNISQIQRLITHLNPACLLHKIPLEGDVSGKENGLSMRFDFTPESYCLEADMKGVITEGAVSLEGADMSLRGIYMDVEYHHGKQLLEFSDIQGALLVGKPRRVEEYFLTGHHIRFIQMAQPDIELDIAITDKDDELVRLVGHTQDEGDGVKNLHLDRNLSHFSIIYPHVWQCRIKDWSEVEQFDFRSQFDLDRFFQDLERFRQTGFLWLSHSIINKISELLPVQGRGIFALRYHPDHSYTYHLEGLNIKHGGSSEHYGLLRGSKQDKRWIIDQLQWDDWNASLELHQMDDNWRIPFLALKAGQTLLLGLEGDWLNEQAVLSAKLKYCDVDLARLDHFDAMKSFVTKWWPKGLLRATGAMEWNLLASSPLEGFKASLSAEVSNFSLRDCSLNISSPFQITLKPYHILSFNNVQIDLSPEKKQVHFDIKKFEYDSLAEGIHSLKAAFQIPQQELEKIGETLHHHFPDVLGAAVKDLAIKSKEQGQLKGLLSIDNSKTSQNFLRLELEDGLYTFKKREYDLKKFQLQIARNELQFSAFSQEERCPFQIVGQTKWPSCQQGQLKLISADSKKPLMINWANPPNERFVIRSILGDFNGCSFLLRENQNSNQNSEWMPLEGQITMDFNRLTSLLSPSMAESVQKLKINSPYTLAGQFWMNSDVGSSFFETVSFKGKLTGKEAIVKGYKMESLQADVQYVPGRLDMQNLVMQDPAGNIKVPNCIVLKSDNENAWKFFIPRIAVRNLRLNLLRSTETAEKSNPKFRSLIFKRIDFQDLHGEISNWETWQGKGGLHFTNASRKNPFHILLAIPAEIILRVGIDPHVLNPVTGTIYFDLRGDKFYLTRFKDVYSEGRGSKFYLAHERSNPSWMDFDGNLSVNVRMKQYNIIFKIAELFTVSIQGHVKKPQYSLQKLPKTNSRGKRRLKSAQTSAD